MTVLLLAVLLFQPVVGRTDLQSAVQAANVRGTVVDARTGAPIPGARVVLAPSTKSMLTAADGAFAFSDVPPGRYTLSVSIIGYIFVRRQVDVVAGAPVELTIPLTEGTGTYQESVSVTPPAAAAEVGVGSQSELGSAALQDLRGVAADDPMRAVQALPGVATGDDFQSQFSVRGSQFRHVGIVLDGTATPLLLHTVRSTNETASIAMINTDVLDRASLVAGPHPQRHGDWLGATLDFGLREGSRDRAQFRGAISATTASAVIEAPIGRSKHGSWLTSVRWSYIDWLIRKIYPSINATLGFKDLQSKFAYDLTPHQQLQFVLIAGAAAFRNENASQANGIRTADSNSELGSVQWRYTRNSWITTQRVSFVGSQFKDLGRLDQELGTGHGRSIIWRGDVTTFLPGQWSIEFGGKTESMNQSITQRNYTIVANRPQERFTTSTSNDTIVASGWGQLARRTKRSGLSIGGRATHDSLSGRVVTSPWLLAERTVGALTLRASVGRSHQFPELELQRGLRDRLAEAADMADAGVEGALPHGMRWQVAGFWRREINVIRRTGEDRLINGKRGFESIFPEFSSSLHGRSRGIDLVFGRRASSGLTGWVAYTWSHTREHDRITGEDFDADFDQRHTLNVFVQERLSYRTAVSAKLRIGSNFPIVGYLQGSVDALKLGAERNQVRLPRYARLDIRANRTFTFDRRRLTLFVELVNVTKHDNFAQGPGSFTGPDFVARNYTEKLLPFIPSVGLLMEF